MSTPRCGVPDVHNHGSKRWHRGTEPISGSDFIEAIMGMESHLMAHAFSPPDGRFHYDADESWSSNPTRSQMDLESVTVHELGHNLGLDHGQYQSAIMYPSIPLGQVDIIGLQALYGY
ncbi:hypothetical protein GQ457_01G010500 [Hibiscus cannabinus]